MDLEYLSNKTYNMFNNIYNELYTIKININKELGEISVWNNGMGIDIAMHKEHNMWVPEMIFGELLTSTNYDDN